MKKILLTSLCLLSLSLSAQNRRYLGFTAGINEYYAKPTFVSAKSGTGFSIGAVGGFSLTRRSDLMFEVNFIRFNMDFLGHKFGDETTTEWLDFHSNRLGLNMLYYYDLMRIKDKYFAFGLHAGPSVTYVNNFTIKGKDNASYQLSPYDMEAIFMKISRYYDGSPFNAFAAAGFQIHYKDFELNCRYHFALNSPYRHLAYPNSPVKIDGKDNFMSVTFNYYIRS